ncbi:hypothetical protein [Streptomyces sp. NPDC088350]|uniref:hypothetical protein n=1 Tax=Streptomyces sp. NPDC088350 TaxID=3365854 RepID=UPI00380FAEC3
MTWNSEALDEIVSNHAGRPVRPTAPEAGIPAVQDLTGSPRVGVWTDETTSCTWS